MGKKSKDQGRRELDGPAEGLQHNPFTQLTGAKGGSGSDAPDASFEQPAQPPSKTSRVQPELIVRRERKGRAGKGVVLVQAGLTAAEISEKREGWIEAWMSVVLR